MAFCHRQFDVFPKGSFSFKPKTLDFNKNERLVLIAGRKILTVLTLHDDKFTLHSNLCKEHDSFNCCDAKWSPFSSCTLATAEKCKVLIWDLNISQKDKLLTEFKAADERALNKISFSEFKSDILISGSYDSKIRGYDIHNNNKIFELAYTDEIVRDIQFSPTNENLIGANYEDGVLAVWDIRRTDQPSMKYQAHTEPAFCLAWHPEQSFIATGGRDKKIRICNVKGAEMECYYTLHAMNKPVARVAWTQQTLNGRTLASISCVGDSFINFWDITKPYSVPFKRSMEQKELLVDFCCIGGSEVVSCSSSGLVMTHSENSAVVMSDSINEISLACNNLGVVQHTYRGSILLGSMNSSLEEMPHNLARPQWSCLTVFDPAMVRTLSPRDRSHSVNIPRTGPFPTKYKTTSIHSHSLSTTVSDTSLKCLPNASPKLCEPIQPIYTRSKEFVLFAQEYRFTSESPIELCRHNERLANRLGREDVAFLWYFCQCILVDKKRLTQGVLLLENKPNPISSPKSLKGRYPWDIVAETKHPISKSIPVTPHSNSTTFFENNEAHEQTNVHEKFPNSIFTDYELEERFESYCQPEKVTDVFSVINNRAKGWWAETDISVPNKLSPYKESTNVQKHLITGEIGLFENRQKQGRGDEPTTPKYPPLDFTHSIASITKYLVENSEIQHAVFIYLCLHEKLVKQIGPPIFIHWVSSYIDILQSFNLDTFACKIYKFLHSLKFYQEIRDCEDKENQCTIYDWDNSTCIGSRECKSCEKPVKSVMPCHECNAWAKQLCSICRLPVYGLCLWCRECQHGGHREHIDDWFKTEKYCPSGCGHHCILSK